MHWPVKRPQTEFEPAISWLTTQMEATIVRDRVSEVVTVTEPEIADGVRWCYQRAKLAVEPGAAVPIAALLARRVSAQPGQRVGVLVSGANPDPVVIAPMLTAQRTSS